MKKVKLSIPPESWDLAKHAPTGKYIWGDYEFFLNQDIKECDFWLVSGNLVYDKEKVIVSPENVIFDTSESADIVNYTESFLSQFYRVSSFRTDLQHPRLMKSVPIIPWFVKKNFDELSILNKIPKTKKISLLASDKKISINHIRRLNFVKKIHAYFGNEIDIYGAGYTDHIYDKAPTLDPYMFSIILETIAVPEYFSEKLGDCFLSSCFPIYYGCTNLSAYFNPKSFEMIDINDFDKSVKVIKFIMNSEKFYESIFEKLIEAKSKYLNNYSIFPVMAGILNQVESLNEKKSSGKQEVQLFKYIQHDYARKIIKRVQTKAYDFFNKS